MSPDLTTFLFEAANFLLLAALLGWIFFRPVRGALERRRAAIEDESRAAAEARQEAERRVEELETRRRELEASLTQTEERVRGEAGREAERILEAARAEAQRERESLKTDLNALRRARVATLAHDAAAAGRMVVVRLLERIEGPELESALVRTACRELHELRRDGGALRPALIESAYPLDDEARSLLEEALGPEDGEVRYAVVPEIVAGVRAVTARGLVDASVDGIARRVEQGLVSWIEAEEVMGG